MPTCPTSKIENLKSKIENSKLAELLAETYGVMVYQEDVLKVVHEMAGLSLGEADILRRAMSGKAGAQEAMESLTERFFAGCRQRGVPEPVIQELWRQIETFARFSFCKGHSAAFAVLSYQVAYLKAHWPAEFMAAVLSNGGGFYGAAAYIQECRRMGLRVLGPDINESAVDYSGKTLQDFRFWIFDFGLEDIGGNSERQRAERQTQALSGERQEAGRLRKEAKGKEISDFGLRISDCGLRVLDFRSQITDCELNDAVREPSDENPKSKIGNRKSEIGWVRVGFAAIKNFPLDLARQIMRVRAERPFAGLQDFLRRVQPSHEATEKLIRVGAFDRFGLPRQRLFIDLDVHFRERANGEGEQLIGV